MKRDITEIPILNFKDYKKNFNEFSADIVSAIHNIGFVAIYYPKLYRQIQQLHNAFLPWADQPLEVKLQHPSYIWKQESAEGVETIDLKGFIHVHPEPDPNDPYTKQLPKNHPFEGFPELLSLAQKTLQKQQNFARKLLRAIGHGTEQWGLGMGKKFFDAKIKNGNSSIRLLDYPPTLYEVGEDGAIRAEAHGDINATTILALPKENGLQVWSKINGVWIDAPEEGDIIMINTGDMLARMTNNFFPSTLHRVKSAGDRRLSFPGFIHFRRYEGSDTDLSCLPQFIGNKGKHYKDCTAREYFNERMERINMKGTKT